MKLEITKTDEEDERKGTNISKPSSCTGKDCKLILDTRSLENFMSTEMMKLKAEGNKRKHL